MAIIMTAAHFRAEYEWYAHKRAALSAGLEPTIVAAIAARRRPWSIQADEAVLYDFCHELLNDHRVSDATFAAAIDAFGERGVVDVTGTLASTRDSRQAYACVLSHVIHPDVGFRVDAGEGDSVPNWRQARVP